MLVDCGPTAPHALGRIGSSLEGIHHVLITHGHPDHLNPAFLLTWQWVSADTRLNVWGPSGAIALCRDWLAPDASVDLHVVAPGDQWTLSTPTGVYTVTAVPAAHGHGDGDVLAEEALLYDVASADGTRLLYATDTGPLPDATIGALAGRFDAVMFDETFGTFTDHGRGHLDLSTLPGVIASLRDGGYVDDDTLLVATHLSHHNPPPAELSAALAGFGVVMFDDLDLVDIAAKTRDRQVSRRITLVTGGARSGKSHHAELLVAHHTDVHYVATGGNRDDDPEWRRRVARHQERRPPSWTTHETTDIEGVLHAAPADSVVLVDCLSLWLTRVLDDLGAWTRADCGGCDGALTARMESVNDALERSAASIVLVTNEVGMGVVPASASGRLFRDCLGRLNALLAQQCDDVVLVVAGRAMAIDRVPEGQR